jgi:hypothetical protein
MTRQYFGVLLFRGLVGLFLLVVLNVLAGPIDMHWAGALFVGFIAYLAASQITQTFFPEDTP